ncbi:DNA polymerase III subunit [Metaclostridioides mangenotii]|uniref:DNA polymerase-3 subunit delta n=1 Tax=Metaclostridioides mangenotii TaxID=1540 RepID=A0ABS4EEP8_9FIRM|nr:DNA polymerase III subunit delta' [Clostridioides mangenotii]MBP1856417.1 DNA polymerase-3 subunit delta' [Clostridioides mangenotii]
MYFDNIIGQSFAKKYLKSSINNDKLNSAYMFEGIDGIGKKKMAYELAKILLEIEHPENSPDYIDVFPNGNSVKVDQIRKLQSDIIIKPHNKYKIYILNNAEKMTVEAQNALLKTLEEPPQYAIIILVTNNKEALLDTIKSRCDIVKFNSIPHNEMVGYLVQNGVEEKKATLLTSFSRGSLERALDLANSTEFTDMRDDVQKFIKVLFDKNTVDILELPNDIDKYKSEIIDLLDIIIDYFRDIVLLKERVDRDMLINIDKITFLESISIKITYSQVSRIIGIIEEAKKKSRSNCNFNINMQVMFLNIYEVIK